MDIDRKVEELFSLFTLEEILEMSDLTHEEAVTILFRAGHIALPPFMEENFYEYMAETTE